MKLYNFTRILALHLFFWGSVILHAQPGTTIINTPIGNGDYKDQQFVKLQTPNGKVTPSGIGQGHLFIDKNVIVSNTYNPAIINVNTVRPHDKNLPVGTIEGIANVDLGGNANYSFGVPIPPGTNGMLPSVSFNYSSAGGDGIMGMGWGINASSSITRVNQDIFHDNYSTPFNFSIVNPQPGSGDLAGTTHDRLVLDGNRLVPQGNDGNGEYHYFFENDDFTKIIYKPTTGSFLVIEKNGLKKEYGNSADSKLTITQGVVTWYLNKVYDNYGNYMQYFYHNINGEIAIKEIKYTGNTTSSTPPYNSIKFYYNTKQVTQTKYIKDNAVPNTLLLREVETFCEGNSVNRYEFKYSYSKYNYLNEVIKYAKDNTNFNSTAFVYGVNPTAPKMLAVEPTFNGSAYSVLPKEDYISADFNNDGKTDILSFQQLSSATIDPNTGFKLYEGFKLNINQSVGTNVNFLTTYSSPIFTPGFFMLPYTGFFNYLFGVSTSPDAVQTGDINGDGYIDLVFPRQGNGLLAGVVAYTFNPVTSQLDNLNLPANNSAQGCPINNWSFRIPGTFNNNANKAGGITNITMGDFNGDGKQEMLTYYRDNTPGNGSELAVFMFDVPTTASPNKYLVLHQNDISPNNLSVSTAAGNAPIQDYSGFSAIDYDGDGKSELMGYRFRGNSSLQQLVILEVTMAPYSNTNYCSFSLKELYNSGNITGLADPGDHSGIGDFNGDGNIDFMSFKENNTKLSYGKGISIDLPLNTISALPGRKSIFRKLLNFDIDNDGKTDLVELYSDESQNKINVSVASGHELNNGLINIGSVPNLYLPPNKDYAHENCDYNYNGNFGCVSTSDLDDSYDDDANRRPTYNIGDYNGDGYNDILIKVRPNPLSQATVNGKFQIIYFYPDSKEKFVTLVLDGYNRFTNFNYSTLALYTALKTSTVNVTYPLAKMQKPIAVVSALVQDGIQVGGNGVVSSTTFYDYNDLIIHHQGKGSLGFARFTSYNSLTNISVQNEYKISPNYFYPYLYKSKTLYLPSSTLLKTITNTVSDVGTTPDPRRKRFFSKLDNTVLINHPRGVTVTGNYTYDAFANITHKQTITSAGSNSETSDLYYTSPVSAGNWGVINKFQNEQMINQYKSNPAYTRYVTYAYDLTKGYKITMTADPSSSQKVITNYVYDNTFGVLNQINISAPSDPNAQANSTTFNYDPFKRLPIKQTGDLNYSTELTYDFEYGNPLTSKVINGLITNYKYDVFGRLKETKSPEGITNTLSYNWFTSANINPNDPLPVNPLFTLYYINSKTTNQPDVNAYVDLFERPIKSETQAFNGQTRSNLIRYDARGNAIFKTDPYFIPLPIGQQVLVTTNLFNPVLNQLISSTSTDGVINNVISNIYNYNTSNGELTTTSTLPDTKQKVRTVDFTDKVIQESDNGGTLDYEYSNSFSALSKTWLNGTQVNTSTFDLFGRPDQVTEVNSGTKKYTFNAYGQLISKLDAKNITSTYAYDVIGRITSESIGPEQINYTYNNTGIGIGQLGQVTNITNNISYKFYYDNLARLNQKDILVNAQTYTSKYEYDNLSRPSKYIYPNNFAIKYIYNSNGYPLQIQNASNNQVIWQADEMNHLNGYSKYTLGNGIQSIKTYNNLGIPQSFVSGVIENLSYNINNQNGNVNSISDNITGNTETYLYDNLDRLTTTNVNSTGAKTINYDAKGNITSKWDAGNFLYDNAKINQVNAVGNANNEISHTQQDITYNTYDQPVTIEEGIEKVIITYGCNKNRIKTQFLTSNIVTKNRYYLDDFEVETDAAGNLTQQINYISGPSGMVGLFVTDVPSGGQNLYYTYYDHLATITKVTNSTGGLIAQQNFDAWGRRRNTANWTFSGVTAPPNWLYRGYTGHEMLPQFELINMNGRLYDPMLGRMLSADPMTQSENGTQAYNKYTYANNNPLKYNDPSGHSIIGAILAGSSSGAWALAGTGGPGSALAIGGLAITGAGVAAIAYGGIRAMQNPYGTRPLADMCTEETNQEFHARADMAIRPNVSTASSPGYDWMNDYSFVTASRKNLRAVITSHGEDHGLTDVYVCTTYIEEIIRTGQWENLPTSSSGAGNPDVGKSFSELVNGPVMNNFVSSLGTVSGYADFSIGVFSSSVMGGKESFKSFTYENGERVTNDIARSNAKFAKGLKVTGKVFVGLNFATDTWGLINYFNDKDPDQYHVVTPVKFGLNTTFTAIGIFGGPIGAGIATTYFIGDIIFNIGPSNPCATCPSFNPLINRNDETNVRINKIIFR